MSSEGERRDGYRQRNEYTRGETRKWVAYIDGIVMIVKDDGNVKLGTDFE